MLQGRVIPFTDWADTHPRRSQIVVQIGRDEELLRLRAKLLSSAGYTVYSMTPEQAAADLRSRSGPKIWLFCQSLQCQEPVLLAAAIRDSWPEDKLLRLTGLYDNVDLPGLFDQLLEPVKGVDDLLRVVAQLARQLS